MDYYELAHWSMARVFINDLGDWSLIPGQVMPKTQKMVLDTSLLNIQQYKVRIKSKWSKSEKGVAPSPTSSCSSYWEENLRVNLDYGRPAYIYIYIYIQICMYICIYLYIYACVFCNLKNAFYNVYKNPSYTTHITTIFLKDGFSVK